MVNISMYLRRPCDRRRDGNECHNLQMLFSWNIKVHSNSVQPTETMFRRCIFIFFSFLLLGYSTSYMGMGDTFININQQNIFTSLNCLKAFSTECWIMITMVVLSKPKLEPPVILCFCFQCFPRNEARSRPDQ